MYILNSLVSLKQIDLHENHWFCDCRILDLRSRIVDRSISITVPPICDKPIRLKGASWQSLDQDEFACNPKIASLNGAKFIEGRNGTIVCRVQSTPLSNISWYFESPVAANHLIKNATYMSFGKQYITIREILKDNVQISKLIITNTIEKDAGRYTCYAANKAGNVSSSVIIRVIQPENTGEESLVLSEKDEQVGIILATILVFLLLVLSACFIVLRHKTSFLSSIFKSSRGQSEVIESNVILDSSYLNHNSKSPIAINDNEHDQKRYIPHQSTKYSTGTTATVLGAKDTIVITQPNGSAGITSDTLVKVFQPNQQLTVENNSPNNTNTNKSLDESGFEKCLESYLMVSEDESMLLPSRTNEVRFDPIIQQNDQQLTQQEQQLVNNWGQDAYDQAVYSTRSLNRRYSDSSATLMVKQLNVNSSGVNNSRVTIRDDSLELLPRNDNQNSQTTTNERFRSRRLSEGVISGRINSLWNRNNVNHSNQPLSSTNNIYPNEDYNNWTVGDSGQVVVNGDSNYFKGNFIGSEKESLLRRNGFTNVDYSTLQAPRRCSKSGLSSQFNNTPTSNYLRALSLEDSLNPTFPVIHESSKEYESDFKN
uniref:Ig-like domain-containing protein n=1 Tax=Tetranychus urticae TaxID=32264 RepID=T1KZM6_TETUR